MLKSYELPIWLQKFIAEGLRRYRIEINLEDSGEFQKSSIHDPAMAGSRKIAESVLKLSDFYIQSPDQATPWDQPWCQIAYLGYYLPLNFIRSTYVFQTVKQRNLLKGVDTVIDFGAGLASEALAASEVLDADFFLIERSDIPESIYQMSSAPALSKRWKWSEDLESAKAPQKDGRKTLGLFSYSLTELSELPEWALHLDQLLLIEPSTQDDGRKLMEIRKKLIASGWNIDGPCLHQEACPLLENSKSDWCHFRVGFDSPNWFKAVETFLPMRNETLTMSYLVASRKNSSRFSPTTPLQESPEALSQESPEALSQKSLGAPSQESGAALVVGDLMSEKGKDRQLICRSSQREFLAWMHRDWPERTKRDFASKADSENLGLRILDRGEIISVGPHEMKSNEIRLKR